MAGSLLGSRLAFTSVVTYLITGLLGVPVFAAGGVPAYLIRPTFGFLLGFALAVFVIGYLCESIRPVKFWQMMILVASEDTGNGLGNRGLLHSPLTNLYLWIHSTV